MTPPLHNGAVQLHNVDGFSRALSAGEITRRSKEGRLRTPPTPNWISVL